MNNGTDYDFTGKYRFRAFLCFGLIVAAVLLGSVSLAREVAVLKVEHRWAAELLPIVKSMLSQDGTVTASERVNSLVIVDTPEAIERVKTYLDRFDRPVEQVRIHVRVFGIQTELTVPLGPWVEIGGTTDQKNEIIREIFSLGSSRGQSSSSMSLMVERP